MPHSLTKLWVHAIWSTKDHKPVLNGQLRSQVIQRITSRFEELECGVRIIDGMSEHLHALFLLSPKKSLKEVITAITDDSSHWINRQNLVENNFAWQPGYAAFSVSQANVKQVEAFIRNQADYHRKMPFEQELALLLAKHGLEENRIIAVKLWIHLVWSTKNRVHLIHQDMKPRLIQHLQGQCASMRVDLRMINSMPEHVHAFFLLPAEMALAEVAKNMKGESSFWINQQKLLKYRFGWQIGYGGFSVSESAAQKVEDYIRNQGEHHRKMTFQEEYNLLLKRHGLDENR